MSFFRRRDLVAAFSRTQLVIVIVLVAIVSILAWPTISSALAKRDLTRTMNNAREFYLAGLRMANDGAAKSDAGRAWPGDYQANTLAEYCTKLLQNDYVTAADLERILSSRDTHCTVTATSGLPVTVTLFGKSALKVYKVKNSDPSTTIFAASSNYIYDAALNPDAKPFGDVGFVVVHKSGDAGIFGKNQATPAGFENNAAKFQSPTGVGKLPGAADGTVAPGEGATVLAGPQ